MDLTPDEADAAWRAEREAELAAQPWWEGWCAFRETLLGYNPMHAFAAGFAAGRAAEPEPTG